MAKWDGTSIMIRRRVGMRLADLEPILGGPAREGRLRITKEMVSLV